LFAVASYDCVAFGIDVHDQHIGAATDWAILNVLLLMALGVIDGDDNFLTAIVANINSV
jgi:hypothetical protein